MTLIDFLNNAINSLCFWSNDLNDKLIRYDNSKSFYLNMVPDDVLGLFIDLNIYTHKTDNCGIYSHLTSKLESGFTRIIIYGKSNISEQEIKNTIFNHFNTEIKKEQINIRLSKMLKDF